MGGRGFKIGQKLIMQSVNDPKLNVDYFTIKCNLFYNSFVVFPHIFKEKFYYAIDLSINIMFLTF